MEAETTDGEEREVGVEAADGGRGRLRLAAGGSTGVRANNSSRASGEGAGAASSSNAPRLAAEGSEAARSRGAAQQARGLTGYAIGEDMEERTK